MTKINELHNRWTDREVEKHWDSVADIYVECNKDVSEAHVQRFDESIGWLELFAGARVLNITSRDCEAVEYIKKLCPDAEVVNAEISQRLMDVAKSIRPYVNQIKLRSYSELPFEDAYFDRVISLETLEHVACPLKFLEELYRVSKDNAVLVLSCPPATSEPAYRLYTFIFGGHGEGPHKFLSSRKIKKMLELSGWKLTHHKGTLLMPVGPKFLRNFGEYIIKKFQKTFISEFGIRQFYVCKKHR